MVLEIKTFVKFDTCVQHWTLWWKKSEIINEILNFPSTQQENEDQKFVVVGENYRRSKK